MWPFHYVVVLTLEDTYFQGMYVKYIHSLTKLYRKIIHHISYIYTYFQSTLYTYAYVCSARFVQFNLDENVIFLNFQKFKEIGFHYFERMSLILLGF